MIPGAARRTNRAETTAHGNATKELYETFHRPVFCAALPASMVKDASQEKGGKTLSKFLARKSTGLGMDLKAEAPIESLRQRWRNYVKMELIVKLAPSDGVSPVSKCRSVYWEERLLGVRDAENCNKTDDAWYIMSFNRLLEAPAGGTNESTHSASRFPHYLTPTTPDSLPLLKPTRFAEPYVVFVGFFPDPLLTIKFRLDYFELCPLRPPEPVSSFPRLAPVASGKMPGLSLELISRILSYPDLKSMWQTLLCSRQWFSLAGRSDAPLWRLLHFRFRWYRDASNPKELFCRFAKGFRFSATTMEYGNHFNPYGARSSEYGGIIAVLGKCEWIRAWKLVDNVLPGENKIRVRVVAENTRWKYRVFVATLPKKEHERIHRRPGLELDEKLFANDDNLVLVHEESIVFQPGEEHPSALHIIQRDGLFAVVEMHETLKVTELTEVCLGIRGSTFRSIPEDIKE